MGNLLRSDAGEVVVMRLARFGQEQKLLHLACHVFDVAQQRVAATLSQFDLCADQRERSLQLVLYASSVSPSAAHPARVWGASPHRRRTRARA